MSYFKSNIYRYYIYLDENVSKLIKKNLMDDVIPQKVRQISLRDQITLMIDSHASNSTNTEKQLNYSYNPYQFPSNFYLALFHQACNVIDNKNTLKQLENYFESLSTEERLFIKSLDWNKCPCCKAELNDSPNNNILGRIITNQYGLTLRVYFRIIILMMMVILISLMLILPTQIYISIQIQKRSGQPVTLSGSLLLNLTVIQTVLSEWEIILVIIVSELILMVYQIFGFFQILLSEYEQIKYQDIINQETEIMNRTFIISGIDKYTSYEDVRNLIANKIISKNPNLNSKVVYRQIKINYLLYFLDTNEVKSKQKKIEKFIKQWKSQQKEFDVQQALNDLPKKFTQTNVLLIQFSAQTPYSYIQLIRKENIIYFEMLRKKFYFFYFLCFCFVFQGFSKCFKKSIHRRWEKLTWKDEKAQIYKEGSFLSSPIGMDQKFLLSPYLVDQDFEDRKSYIFNYQNVTFKTAPLPKQIEYSKINLKKKISSLFYLKKTIIQFIVLTLIFLVILLIIILSVIQILGQFIFNISKLNNYTQTKIFNWIISMMIVGLQYSCFFLYDKGIKIRKAFNEQNQLQRKMQVKIFITLLILLGLQLSNFLNFVQDSNEILYQISLYAFNTAFLKIFFSYFNIYYLWKLQKQWRLKKKYATCVPKLQKDLQKIFTPLIFNLEDRIIWANQLFFIALIFIFYSPLITIFILVSIFLLYLIDLNINLQRYQYDKRWNLRVLLQTQLFAFIIGYFMINSQFIRLFGDLNTFMEVFQYFLYFGWIIFYANRNLLTRYFLKHMQKFDEWFEFAKKKTTLTRRKTDILFQCKIDQNNLKSYTDYYQHYKAFLNQNFHLEQLSNSLEECIFEQKLRQTNKLI